MAEVVAGAAVAGAVTNVATAYQGGQKAKAAYDLQAKLNARNGEMERQAILAAQYEAELLRKQALEARREAESLGTAGRMKAEAMQDDTDTKAAQIYARAAKFGIVVPTGSALDVMHAFSLDRGEGLAQLNWQTGQSVYAKQFESYIKESNAALTLYGTQVREANLSMYPYQSELYRLAGDQAVEDSRLRMASAFFGGVASTGSALYKSGSNFGTGAFRTKSI